MYHVRRLTIIAVALGVLVFLLWLLPRLLNPTPPSREERRRDRNWVDSSPFWVDRQACLWLGLCGVHHVRWDPPSLSANHSDDGGELRRLELRSAWGEDEETKAWEDARRMDRRRIATRGKKGAKILKEVPDYVLKYAPLVHLYSGESFWPSDIAEHIKHMRPYENGTELNITDVVTLENLAKLNGEPFPVYLTSQDDVEERPEWLHSHVGVPVPFADGDDDGSDDGFPPSSGDDETAIWFGEGSTWYDVDKKHPLQRISDPRRLPIPRRSWQPPNHAQRRELPDQVPLPPLSLQGHKPDRSGYSKAPAILILVDKGSGILDAFWFFFYSYNLGQTVLDIRFGNHVGDWEHCMMRFEAGVPRAMFISEHAGGQAYAWQALEKRRVANHDTGETAAPDPERPVIYSAVGSHAMYATSGLHPYVLPFHMLADVTDRGPLWDPALNNLAFWYDYEADGYVEPEAFEPAAAAEAALQLNFLANDSAASSAGWARLFAASFNPAAPVPPIESTALEAEMASNTTAASISLGREGGDDADEEGKLTSLTPAASNPSAPTSWFHFAGPWGDALYPLSDPRQWRLFGQYHYHTGPLGPRFKNLAREKVCQTPRCRILWNIEDGKKGTWYN